MGADFLDGAVFHVEDHIGVQNGGKAVGNDKAGTPLHEFCHGFLDEDLGVGINIGGGFVQNHDFRVGGNGACDGEQLAFALGNVFRPFGEKHVVATR